MKVYRVKKKRLEEIESSHTESYGKLPKYTELIRQTNPSSVVKLYNGRPNELVESRFLRLLISFKAQK